MEELTLKQSKNLINYLYHLSLGIWGVVFYFITTVLCSTLVIIFGGLARLLAWAGLKPLLIKIATDIPVIWAQLLIWHMNLAGRGKWDIQGDFTTLSRHQWYLLIANHSTWVDILVLLKTFNTRTPIIKFFMKKQLLWSLPVAGIACWILGYPFMQRHTPSEIRRNPELKGKDIQTTQEACEKFKISPTVIMNFVEGTRFTAEKKERHASPYQFLLKPKVGGLAIVIEKLHTQLAGILNVTIHYAEPGLNLWNFLCGRYSKITVRYELIPITNNLIGNYYEDRNFRQGIQTWLNGVWQEKDSQLQELTSHQEFPLR